MQRTGEWVNVSLPVGAPEAPLVVNAGDLTELWTNGRWRSAPHRVVPVFPHGRVSLDRLSVAFFTGPDHDALVEPIVLLGDAPRYEPTTAGAHLAMKLAATNTGAPRA